jgi:hypothetical protein
MINEKLGKNIIKFTVLIHFLFKIYNISGLLLYFFIYLFINFD